MGKKLQEETPSVTASQAQTDALLEKVQKQIVENSFDYQDEKLLGTMVESLGDKRGMVRLGFAEALGAVGKPATPFLLSALANHSNPVVRRASAKTLTLIADPQAIPNLIEALLKDEDTVVKGSAAGALARTGKVAAPALLKIVASPEYPESIKGHAAWALAFIGAEAKEQLYKAAKSNSPEVRTAVIGAIANFTEETPDEQAFAILSNALTDENSTVRSEAAAALGKLAYQPAIPKLIELLQHSHGDMRKAAALALMKMSDRFAANVGYHTILNSLKIALEQESEEFVKKVFALAIAQLERKLEDGNEDDWDD